MTTAEQRKALIHTLLKGLETGDPESVAVVDEQRYIQHNPQTAEGSVGLAELFARIAKSHPRVNLVRLFSDGDYVFGHTEYDFSTRRIGFEVFRFDGDKAVEHWDNIQPRLGPNHSGRSMVDGQTVATDLDRTEDNRRRAAEFVRTVLIGRQLERLPEFVADDLMQHDPGLTDGRDALRQSLEVRHEDAFDIAYQTLHRVLAEGCFALCVSEGTRGGVHTAFYDLYRFIDGVIVEHWNTVEHVAPRSEWKNNNGKF